MYAAIDQDAGQGGYGCWIPGPLARGGDSELTGSADAALVELI